MLWQAVTSLCAPGLGVSDGWLTFTALGVRSSAAPRRARVARRVPSLGHPARLAGSLLEQLAGFRGAGEWTPGSRISGDRVPPAAGSGRDPVADDTGVGQRGELGRVEAELAGQDLGVVLAQGGRRPCRCWTGFEEKRIGQPG